jgi:hypothetical protein
MLCQCGCGVETGVYTNSSRGHRKGEPRKFLVGHHISTEKIGKDFYCQRGHERLPENVYRNGTCKLCAYIVNAARDPKLHSAQSLKWGRTEIGIASREASRLKNIYNLTTEQKQNMLTAQDNKCKLCGKAFDVNIKALVPHVDHDHECCLGRKSCGKCIRGFLCRTCNSFLGLVKDNITTLENAIQYLKETQCKTQEKPISFV